MRAAAPAALLAALAVALAGCADGPAEGLARPTAATILPSIPTAADGPQGPRVYDDADPGYRVETPWRVGDGWDYESNATRAEVRTLRVAEAREAGNRTLFRLDETIGRIGNPAESRLTRWVDSADWTLLEIDDQVGTRTVFEPGQPLRFYRNATFSYNATSRDAFTGEVRTTPYRVASYVEPAWEGVRLPWGFVGAVHVVYDVFADGARTPAKADVWVKTDYGQPARYASGGVGWTLVALKEGDRTLGSLQPTT